MSDDNHVIIDPTDPDPVPTPTPTPVPPSPKSPLDPVKVKATIDLILKVADGIGTIIDDESLTSVLAFAHKYADEDWFIQLVTLALNTFRSTGKLPTESEMVSAVSRLRAGHKLA